MAILTQDEIFFTQFEPKVQNRFIMYMDGIPTYMIKGLPPTPISIVSISSLEAAVLGTPGDYLFFVADTPTSHHFSKTYEEHKRMIKKIGLDK